MKPKGHAMKLQRTWVLPASFLLVAGLSSCGEQQNTEVKTESEKQKADNAIIPAQTLTRNPARKNTSKDNLKNLGLAIHHYAGIHNDELPSGKKNPLLSWRVHLLPYIQEKSLYDRFNFDEPWDSEHNKKLINEMPALYASPTSKVADEDKTVYLAVIGKDTAFERGAHVGLFMPDGNARTIMVVEVSDEKAAIWTKPDDWEYQPDKPFDGLMGQHPGFFLALFADTVVREIPPSVDQKSFQEWILCNDGKPDGPVEIGR